ncbi:uncharacterized protein LOC111041193 isoform X2 [Myzus persicae]|uniref:uncharacterized protein LOC111041193 isoform X2 n=1 Tax=Myzus persicae TaxID=13164 RepID=UPI000B9339C8|nr:uncharacterized protein LOC111041193 isoform X2 [Myzus persicae]
MLSYSPINTCNISEILQVCAPQMYGMFKLRYEEMKLVAGKNVKKRLLYHVTTESRALESLETGLDWRRTVRAKYGYGVSFSDDADYANFYADKFTDEDERVIMICSVLVKKIYVIPAEDDGNNLIVPPGRADTTVSHNNRVLVKYNDYEFYPKYFVYYKRRPEHMTNSKYFRRNSHRTRSLVGGMKAMNLH